MNCQKHGEFSGLQCRACFQEDWEAKLLRDFKTKGDAAYKMIIKKEKWHIVLNPGARRTLCAISYVSNNDLSVMLPRESMRENITCEECLRIAG